MTNWQLLAMLIQTCSLTMLMPSPFHPTKQKQKQYTRKYEICFFSSICHHAGKSTVFSSSCHIALDRCQPLWSANLGFLPILWVCDQYRKTPCTLFKHSTTITTTLMKAMLPKKKNAAAWFRIVWQIKVMRILLQHTFCRERVVFSQHLKYLNIVKHCYFQLHENLIWLPALL